MNNLIDPRNILSHVHPDLVRVMLHADSPQRFIIIQGLRTLAQEKSAVASGHSTTMHSRHLPNHDGLADAVDIVALDAKGRPDWAQGCEAATYTPIIAAIKRSAHELSIPIEAGMDWVHFKDWGHIQLPWKQYP